MTESRFNSQGTPPGVFVGVDTHKYSHVAVALNEQGVRLGEISVVADSTGYLQLHHWARSLGHTRAFGVEGTGSYGAGLTRLLRRHDERVVEVNRPDRRSRHLNGKSDPLDAESAARAVLNGTATAIAKCADGRTEMIRQIKVARDSANKARSSAMVILKNTIVSAPSDLREELSVLSNGELIDRCCGFRVGSLDSVRHSTKYSLRALAKRWKELDDEIRKHNEHLGRLTRMVSPTLCEGFGIGPDTAAELLIVFGDNPSRIRSQSALAKLCGVSPIPASSGLTNKHRLHRGGNRQANAAIHRTVIVRMRFHEPTRAYVARRTAEGLTRRDIVRCLKRYVVREMYWRVRADLARFDL